METRNFDTLGSQGDDAWIVADVGGTNARLARWTFAQGLDAGSMARCRNDDFADLAALIEHYRHCTGKAAVQSCLAVALPPSPGTMHMTNRPWSFTLDGLRQRLGLQRLQLVNDFVAAAASVAVLTESEFRQFGGTRGNPGPCLVLGPGTGLGTAVALGDGQRRRVLDSEAGHMGAAPTGPDALAVVERERLRLGRVSWERLLCGSGLAAFDAVARSAQVSTSAAEVAERAIAGDAAARRAATAFAHALGEFAGDLCLALRATGGVYLVGGVLQGLAGAFDASALRAGFENKGRFENWLRSVPCYRVETEDIALRGLAQILGGAVMAPLLDSETAGHAEQADI